jgi:hypothetical protein
MLMRQSRDTKRTLMSARARVVRDSVVAADALGVQIASARATVATWIVIDGQCTCH